MKGEGGALARLALLLPKTECAGKAVLNEISYNLPTRGLESKKPSRDDWAKCLIPMVGAKGFEPSTL